MPKKRFGAEQIVTLLRQIEVSMAQGKPTPVACRDAARPADVIAGDDRPVPTDRNRSGRLTISGLPTRSNRTFSPGEMAVRTFISHVLTNSF
jgi:hypothetical protein